MEEFNHKVLILVSECGTGRMTVPLFLILPIKTLIGSAQTVETAVTELNIRPAKKC